MKCKVYLRIADSPRGHPVKASTKRNVNALGDGYGKYWPTVCIALNIEIPNELFDKAQTEIDLKIKKAEIASDIKITED